MTKYETLFEKYSNDVLTDNTQFKHFERCKDCKHNNDGTLWGNAYNKGYCAMYPRSKYPKGKPNGVYTGETDCPRYEKE